MSYAKILIVLLSYVVFVGALSTRAQDHTESDSTSNGDISRGQGNFLKGKGIYELYSATGRQIDARTEIMVQQWNRQVHGAYAVERTARMQSKKNLSVAQQAATKQKMAEKEKRLRTNPTDDDVVNGDAHNALLFDLSDPMISSSTWRAVPVPLTPGISIRALFFRFAQKLGENNSSLGNNLIALGRLDSFPTTRSGPSAARTRPCTGNCSNSVRRTR